MINSRPLHTLFLTLISAGLLFSSCNDRSDDEPLTGEPELVAEGFQFTEGPYWHPDGFLIFSDIPADIIYRWEPGWNEAEVFLEPSGNSNGIAARPDGTVLIAQHQGRVSELDENNQPVTIADSFEGGRLNSPNDIAVRSDGMIYFTDPPFGVSDEDRELGFSGVFRIDTDGNLSLMFDEFALPNGIVFSPDESYLYMNDSETGDILRFEVDSDGDLHNPQPFANVGEMGQLGGADGMVTDTDGRLYTTGPNGFTVFDDDGNQVHHIEFDHQITNMTWGGDDLDHLYITAPDRVYRLDVNATGWRIDD